MPATIFEFLDFNNVDFSYFTDESCYDEFIHGCDAHWPEFQFQFLLCLGILNFLVV